MIGMVAQITVPLFLILVSALIFYFHFESESSLVAGAIVGISVGYIGGIVELWMYSLGLIILGYYIVRMFSSSKEDVGGGFG